VLFARTGHHVHLAFNVLTAPFRLALGIQILLGSEGTDSATTTYRQSSTADPLSAAALN